MKQLLAMTSAIFGAVVFFIGGIWVAASVGLHEKLHVFAVALPASALGAAMLVTVSRRLYSSSMQRMGGVLCVSVAFGAVAATGLLLRIIQVW